jgi:C6 transcription factor Pro1
MLKQFAASKVRSSEGCWTCRLRRKKCDEARPVCEACGVLEISCHYSDTKPEWMDGGARQKEMADLLKAEVKKQANCRREKKYLATLENGGNPHPHHDSESASDGDYGSSSVQSLHISTPSANSHHSPVQGQDAAYASSVAESAFQMDAVMTTISDITPASSIAPTEATPDSAVDASANPAGAWQIPEPDVFTGAVLPDDRDLNFVMTYLDYVFPFLFPFYRPPLLEGGRGWLLSLLRKNKALFHTALSLSSFFFSVVLEGEHENSQRCKKDNWEQLNIQQDLALRELQKDMSDLNLRGVQGFLLESTLVLESIIQLLVFDVALSHTQNWQMHLDAAIVLFEQILPQPELWRETLSQLGFLIKDPTGLRDKLPYAPDQAAFRFFTADLMYIDIVSATALGRPPRLSRYQAVLFEAQSACVETTPTGIRDPSLNLSDFLGVQNWVMRLISDIATLDSWKKEQKNNGSLSMTALVSKAAMIEDALRGGIACLEAQPLHAEFNPALSTAYTDTNGTNEIQLATLATDPLMYAKATLRTDIIHHTRIWAYAGLTYLSVVVSGWQPASPEVSASVATTTLLLMQLKNPACLLTMMWPYTITGCLVQPEQEQIFRDLVKRIGSLHIFGASRDALAVMENVWKNRDQLDPSFDMAAALSGLGHPVLLV